MSNLGKDSAKTFFNGLITENPTFVLMLGMCPTLAVTSSAINGLGMGLTTTAVLTMSNIIISMLRKIIPDKVRIPAFIVVIASFVTIVGQFLEAYLPSLNDALGMFIPLIVVNCIILGRAESFASKNNFILSAFDGLGMGLGFTMALTLIGMIREMIGAHNVFGITFVALSQYLKMPSSVTDWLSKQYPMSIFVMAPGAFFVLAFIVATITALKNKKNNGRKIALDYSKDCKNGTHDCANCKEKCEHVFYDPNGEDGSVYAKHMKKDKKNLNDDSLEIVNNNRPDKEESDDK